MQGPAAVVGRLPEMRRESIGPARSPWLVALASAGQGLLQPIAIAVLAGVAGASHHHTVRTPECGTRMPTAHALTPRQRVAHPHPTDPQRTRPRDAAGGFMTRSTQEDGTSSWQIAFVPLMFLTLHHVFR